MKKGLIVSPDPETASMLALALELEGWQTCQVPEPSLQLSEAREMDAVILDLVEGISPLRSAEECLKEFGEKPKKVVLLPRGCGRDKAEKQIRSADLLVTRPFHLTKLVARMLDLAK